MTRMSWFLLVVALVSACLAATATAGGGPNPYSGNCNWLGQVVLVGFDYAPPGTRLAQGQKLKILHHEELYNVLGTRFGGNGSSTFGLPDLRGKAPAGLSYAICTSSGDFPSPADPMGSCNFAGQIILDAFPGAITPRHTVPARGQLLPQSNHHVLFSRYGYAFGGSKSAGTFGVPNLQGKAPALLHYKVCTRDPSSYLFRSVDCNWIGQILLSGYQPRAARGTLPARGQLLAINGNQALESLFGTRFGGNGSTTFGLPNLKGKGPSGTHYLVCNSGAYPARS